MQRQYIAGAINETRKLYLLMNRSKLFRHSSGRNLNAVDFFTGKKG